MGTQRDASNSSACREQDSLKFYSVERNRKSRVSADAAIMLVHGLRGSRGTECGLVPCRQDFLLGTNEWLTWQNIIALNSNEIGRISVPVPVQRVHCLPPRATRVSRLYPILLRSRGEHENVRYVLEGFLLRFSQLIARFHGNFLIFRESRIFISPADTDQRWQKIARMNHAQG